MKKRILSLLVSAALLGTATSMPVLAEDDVYNTTYITKGNDVVGFKYYNIDEDYSPGLELQEYLDAESKGTIADPAYYFFMSTNTGVSSENNFAGEPFQIVLTNYSDQEIEGRFFVCMADRDSTKPSERITEIKSDVKQEGIMTQPAYFYACDQTGNKIENEVMKIPAKGSINVHLCVDFSSIISPLSLIMCKIDVNDMATIGFMLTNPEDLTSETNVKLEFQTFPNHSSMFTFALEGEPVTRFSADYTFQPLKDGTSLNETVEENVENTILENNGFETEDGTYAKMDVVKVYKTDTGTLGGIDVTYKYTDGKETEKTGTVEYVPETTITGPTSVLLGVLVYNIPDGSDIAITNVELK